MKNWNRTKIIATIGPASNSQAIIERLIRQGMDIARINLSHGKKREQINSIKLVRAVAQRLNRPIGILIDIPGPKIRLGPLKNKVLFLKKGTLFRLTPEVVLGDERWASINYPHILRKIKKGMSVYFNDGLIKLKVKDIKDRQVVCLVENSGEIRAGKGVNIPGIDLERYIPTLEDEEQLSFALSMQADFIALSFIKEANDLRRIRSFLGRYGKDVFLIAKIEKHEALENIDTIIEASDAIMVARGDLGVEISLEQLPIAQKDIIEKCNQKAKPVIVATQILESMLDSPTPTRAEVTDIANAILDGADCLMLSEETAIGRYPVEAVVTLRKVSSITEGRFPYLKYLTQKTSVNMHTLEAVSYAASWIAHNLEADSIVIPTFTGQTARWVSKFRPQAVIFTLASQKNILRRLNIFWGIHPIFFPSKISLEKLPEKIESLLKKLNLVRKKSKIVIAASNPMGKEGKTNLIQVHHIN